MSTKQEKPPQHVKGCRQTKKQQIRDLLDKQQQERKPVEFPMPDPPQWKPMG